MAARHPTSDAPSIRARATLIEAQANFVGEYVKARPAKYAEVRDAIQARGLLEFPWRFINAGRADCIGRGSLIPPSRFRATGA